MAMASTTNVSTTSFLVTGKKIMGTKPKNHITGF